MENNANSDHEQFIDRQMIELFKGQTEQNTELLRHNNQLLEKLEEKKDIIQRRNTKLQRHNKELFVKLEEKQNIIQEKDSEIKENELLLRKERSHFCVCLSMLILLFVLNYFNML